MQPDRNFPKRFLSTLLLGLHLGTCLLSQNAIGTETPRRLPSMPHGFRIGVEKELTTEPLSQIIHLFDFDHLQKEMASLSPFREGELDNYLEASPEDRLKELPEELRTRLTEGLLLKDILGDIQPSSIIVPGSKPSPVKPRSTFEVQSEQILRRVEWEKLFKRWRELPENEKIQAIRWERLSPLKKAELAIMLARFKNDEGTMKILKLKENIPAPLEDLFSRLSWHQDGEALEFRHKDEIKIEDPEIFLKDVEQLSTITATTKETFNPEQTLKKNSSLHYHVSIEGRNFGELSKLLNDRLFLKRVSQGIISDLTGDGKGLYSPLPFRNRGLLRQVADNRIEFRAHVEPLLNELKLNLELLKMPEQEASEKLQSEISKLMSTETLTRIAQYDTYLLENICTKHPTYDRKALASAIRNLAQNFIQSSVYEKELEGAYLLLFDIKDTGNPDSINEFNKLLFERTSHDTKYNYFETGHFKIVSNQIFLDSKPPNDIKLLKLLLNIPNYFTTYIAEIKKTLEIIKNAPQKEKQQLVDKILSAENTQPLLKRQLIKSAKKGGFGEIKNNFLEIEKDLKPESLAHPCANKFSQF